MESNTAFAQRTKQVGKSSTLLPKFEDLTPCIGSHMEDSPVTIFTMSSPEHVYNAHGILHWQIDMQSQPLPLTILERRRHTDPAAYPVQKSSRLYSYRRIQ